MSDAAMTLLRANEAVLREKLADYRRYQETPAYKALEAEKARIREERRQEFLAFAMEGWPVSRNLVAVLGRK